MVGELSTRSELFRTRWATHDVLQHRGGVKRLPSARRGRTRPLVRPGRRLLPPPRTVPRSRLMYPPCAAFRARVGSEGNRSLEHVHKSTSPSRSRPWSTRGWEHQDSRSAGSPWAV
ncbi:MmyB family transcriptional regulator [Kitasatospora sp. NBC_01302]|uniref:MmyB family transcriptional regulator n=1 Tax=Kitasatospora sp. NBC_01302 TaxID=2903575 RepID=UPI003FA3C046